MFALFPYGLSIQQMEQNTEQFTKQQISLVHLLKEILIKFLHFSTNAKFDNDGLIHQKVTFQQEAI